MIKYKPVSHKK